MDRRVKPGNDDVNLGRVRAQAFDQLRLDVLCTGIVNLARSRRHVTASAVHKAEDANIDRRGAVV
jgi:hypothetical protein